MDCLGGRLPGGKPDSRSGHPRSVSWVFVSLGVVPTLGLPQGKGVWWTLLQQFYLWSTFFTGSYGPLALTVVQSDALHSWKVCATLLSSAACWFGPGGGALGRP